MHLRFNRAKERSSHELWLIVPAKRLRFESGEKKKSANSPVGKWLVPECVISESQHWLASKPLMPGLSPFSPVLEKCFGIFTALSSFKHQQSHHTQHSLVPALSVSMSYPLAILLCVGLLHQTARAVMMDKLADNKICGDAECSCKSGQEREAWHSVQSVSCNLLCN